MEAIIRDAAAFSDAQLETQFETLLDAAAQTATLVQAFRPVIIARAGLGRNGAACATFPLPELDRFAQGVSLFDAMTLPVDPDWLLRAAKALLPALSGGLPDLAPDIDALLAALETDALDLEQALRHFLHSSSPASLPPGIRAEALEFVLRQLAELAARRVARPLQNALPLELWTKGWCPVCGSPPALSTISGLEGVRHLRCGLCGFDWRFPRTQCPFCDDDDIRNRQMHSIDDRPSERAETCAVCNRYLLALDMRPLDRPVAYEIQTIAMAHLDLLMQDKGYIPGARGTQVDNRD